MEVTDYGIFKNGGGVKKDERLKHKEDTIEVVNNCKDLIEYNFTYKNKYTKHLKITAGKFQRAIDTTQPGASYD